MTKIEKSYSDVTEEEIREYLEGLDEEAKTIDEYYESNGYENGKDITKRDVYFTSMMAKMQKEIFRLRQWEDVGETFARRLINPKRFLTEVHKKLYDPTYFVFSGLWLEVEVYFLPMRYVKVGKTRKGNHSVTYFQPPVDPEKLGLPSGDEVAYNTFRPVTHTYGVCISLRGNQEWLKKFIPYARSWDYLKVD